MTENVYIQRATQSEIDKYSVTQPLRNDRDVAKERDYLRKKHEQERQELAKFDRAFLNDAFFYAFKTSLAANTIQTFEAYVKGFTGTPFNKSENEIIDDMNRMNLDTNDEDFTNLLFDSLTEEQYKINLKKIQEEQEWRRRSQNNSGVSNLMTAMLFDPLNLLPIGLLGAGTKLASKSSKLYKGYLARNATRGTILGTEFVAWDYLDGKTRVGYESNPAIAFGMGFGLGFGGGSILDAYRSHRANKSKDLNKDQIKVYNNGNKTEDEFFAEQERVQNIDRLKSAKVPIGNMKQSIVRKVNLIEDEVAKVETREQTLQQDINNNKVVIEGLNDFINKTPDGEEIKNTLTKLSKLTEQNKKLVKDLNDLDQKKINRQVGIIKNNIVPDEDLDLISSIAARNEAKFEINQLSNEVNELQRATNDPETFRQDFPDDFKYLENVKKQFDDLKPRVEKPNKADVNDVINNELNSSKNKNLIIKKAKEEIVNEVKILRQQLKDFDGLTNRKESGALKRRITNLEKEFNKPSNKRIKKVKKEFQGNIGEISVIKAQQLNKKRIAEIKTKLTGIETKIKNKISRSNTVKNLTNQVESKVKELIELNKFKLNQDRIKKVTKQKKAKLKGKKIPKSAVEDYAKILIERRIENNITKNESIISDLKNTKVNSEMFDDVLKNIDSINKKNQVNLKNLKKIQGMKSQLKEELDLNRQALSNIGNRKDTEMFDMKETSSKLKQIYIRELKNLDNRVPFVEKQTGLIYKVSPKIMGDIDASISFSELQFTRAVSDIPDDIDALNNIEYPKAPLVGSKEYFDNLGVNMNELSKIDIEDIKTVGYSIWREKSSGFINSNQIKKGIKERQDKLVKNNPELKDEMIDTNAPDINESTTKLAEESENPKSIFGWLKTLKDFGELVGTDTNPVLRGLGLKVFNPVSDVMNGKGTKTLENEMMILIRVYQKEWDDTIKGIFFKARKSGIKQASRMSAAYNSDFKIKAMEDAGKYIRDKSPDKYNSYKSSGPYWEMVADLGSKYKEINGKLNAEGKKSGHEFFQTYKEDPFALNRIYNSNKIIDINMRFGNDALERLFRAAILREQPELKTLRTERGTFYIDELAPAMAKIVSNKSTDTLDLSKFMGSKSSLSETLYFIKDQLPNNKGSDIDQQMIDNIIKWNADRRLKSKSPNKSKMMLDENTEITLVNKQGQTETISFESILESDVNKIMAMNIRAFSGRIVQGNHGIRTASYWRDKLDEAINLEDRTQYKSIVENDKRNSFITDMFHAMEATMNGKPLKSIDFMNSSFGKIARVLKQYAVAVYLGRAFISYFVEHAKVIAINPVQGLTDLALMAPRVIQGIAGTDKILDDATLKLISKDRYTREIESVYGHMSSMAEIPILKGRNNPMDNFDSNTILDKADYKTKQAARITGRANEEVEINIRLSAHKAVLQNIADVFSKGKIKFNKTQIAEAGISEQRFREISEAIQPYITRRDSWLLKDKVNHINLKGFEFDHPELFNDLIYSTANIVDTVVLRPKNSRRQPWLSYPFMDLLMLFRTFSMQSLVQDGFKMYAHDKVSMANNIMAMATMGTAVYTAQIYLNAMSVQRNERQEYFDKYLSPEMVAAGGVARVSPFGLLLPAFDFTAEYTVGESIFGNNVRGSGLDTGLIEGNPMYKIIAGYGQIGESALSAARFGENFTKSDFYNSIYQITPMRNVPGINNILNEIKFRLPDDKLDAKKIKENQRKFRSDISDL